MRLVNRGLGKIDFSGGDILYFPEGLLGFEEFKRYNVQRALIMGITGQDGSYLAEFLLEVGYQVYGLVRRNASNNIWRIEHILDSITLIGGDLLDF